MVFERNRDGSNRKQEHQNNRYNNKKKKTKRKWIQKTTRQYNKTKQKQKQQQKEQQRKGTSITKQRQHTFETIDTNKIIIREEKITTVETPETTIMNDNIFDDEYSETESTISGFTEESGAIRSPPQLIEFKTEKN